MELRRPLPVNTPFGFFLFYWKLAEKSKPFDSDIHADTEPRLETCGKGGASSPLGL